MDTSKFNNFIVSLSGGKDSTALLIYIERVLKLPTTRVFMDTGWEHPETYAYVDYLEKEFGEIIRLKSDKGGFEELAVQRKRFPSATARFCTQELKIFPFKKWLKDKATEGSVVCVGVRADESRARAKLPEFVPKDEGYKVPLWRPILKWSVKDVFKLHADYGIKVNPLYLKGLGRVGCMPCIMANLGELKAIAEYYPETFDKIAEAESKVGCSSFFPVDKIPKRFHSGKIDRSGKAWTVPTPEDVRQYVLMDKSERRKADELVETIVEPKPCQSQYGLCE